MLRIPVIRWGKAYDSLDRQRIDHFFTGEPIAEIGQANAGLVRRDLRRAAAARDALRRTDCGELLDRLARAADLFLRGELPLGNDRQSADDFVHQQSASSGLPEHMCRANMEKNAFVLANMGRILDSLTRGLDLSILSRGYGMEDRGVLVSYQAQSPVLGAVLPSNSPGVHTLWLPAMALQLGLVLKPGSQEPWTPYRIMAACIGAGIPAEAFGLYPGGHETGAAIIAACERSMVFGGTQTVEQYRGNPRVQVHGPGFSKIVLGDDVVDQWPDYIDLMADSIFTNGGRSCINCSGIWASRHTRAIASALAERLGPVDVLPPDDPNAGLAAFTVPGTAQAIWQMIEAELESPGVEHMTAEYGPRLAEHSRCAYLRPTIIHCSSPESEVAKKEYMFPFATVVTCPQADMVRQLGPTLVCTAITRDEAFLREPTDATHIDRLNVGPIPTVRLNWLQPHEGNLLDFLFRSRAYQIAEQWLGAT